MQAIIVKEFANLEKIARENCFSLELVKSVAKKVATDTKGMVLKKVSGVGLVLKKKI
jgi:hypothetical protein